MKKSCEFKHEFHNNTKKVPTFLLHFPVVFCTRFLGEKVYYHLREHRASGLFLENGQRKVQNFSERDTTSINILELFVLYIFLKYEKEISFMAAPEMSQIKPTDTKTLNCFKCGD